MGFLDKFRKKHDTKDEPARSRRGNNKDYPLISKIGFQDMIGETLLSKVAELAEKDDNFVTPVDGGYLLLALTEDDLEQIKESSQQDGSDEYGEFFHLLQDERIATATLRTDLEQGIVGIIPTKETFRVLMEYDAFSELTEREKQIALHFAVLPDKLPDDEDTYHMRMLDSRLTPNDISALLDGKKVIVARSLENVHLAAYNDATGQAEERTPDTPDDTAEEPTPADNAYSRSDNNNVGEQQYTGKQLSQYLNTGKLPQSNTTDSSDDAGDALTQKIQNLEQAQANHNAPDNAPESTEPEPASQDDGLGEIGGANTDDITDDTNTDGGDVEAPDTGEELPQLDDQELSRRSHSDMSMAEREELRSSLSDRQIKLSQNADFNVGLDTANLDRLLSTFKAPKLELVKVKNDDDLLTKTLNAERQDANSVFAQKFDSLVNQTYSLYIQSMNAAGQKVQAKYVITDDGTNQFAKQVQALRKTRDEKLANVDDQTSEFEKNIRSEYQRKREADIEKRIAVMRANYDNAHEYDIKNEVQNFKTSLINNANTECARGIEDVLFKRNEISQSVMQQVDGAIQEKVMEYFGKGYDQLMTLFRAMQDKIARKADDNYNVDVQRQHDLADGRHYQQRIANLEDEVAAEKANNEQQAQEMKDALAAKDAQVQQDIAKAKQQAAADKEKADQDHAMEVAELQDKITNLVNEKRDEVEKIQQKYRQREEAMQNANQDEISSLKQSHLDEVNQLRTQQAKRLDEAEHEIRSAKRRNVGLMLVLTLLGVIIGAFIGGGVIGALLH